jgi:hypothetical protein
MVPMIRISDDTYRRLQHPLIAKPFDDTPGTAIDKLLDFFEQQHGISQPAPSASNGATTTAPSNGTTYDPDRPPDLTNTKIIAAEFAGQRYYPRALLRMKGLTWNGLVKVANRYAFDQVKTFDKFRNLTKSNVENGRSTDRGFHYFQEIDISIQYVDAEHAWSNILHLARQLNVPVTIEFEWSTQKRGILAWAPPTK